MKKNLKKIFAVAVVAACLSLSVTGTLAYFTAEETAHNVITSGDVAVDLIEKRVVNGELVDFPEEEGIFGVMPNTTESKIVTIENIGGGDAYVRVKVESVITLADGSAGDPVYMTPNYNAAAKEALGVEPWVLGNDGWWYYMADSATGNAGLLASGEVTQPLFSEVAFSAQMPNAYQNATAVITVAVQAVQVANNGSTALEAQGWPVEGEGAGNGSEA